MRISTKTFQTVFSPSERGNLFSFSQILTFTILLLTILNLSGCGRAGDQTLDEATKGGTTSPIGMQYIGGDNQSGFAGFMFGQELVVKTYAGTTGLPSFTIRFSEVTGSGATILTPVTTTGGDGIARTKILPSPTQPGNLRFKAELIAGEVGQFASGFAPIFFDLEAKRGAHHIEVHQGNNQTVTVNQAAPINPTVKIVDANGDPVADWPITFTVTSGGGSITSTTKSDANGLAAVTWTMGTNSDLTNQLRANAITISNPNTLNFEADAIPDAPATILLSGGNTSVTAGDCTAVYNIQLRDQYNNISPAQGATSINLTDGASGTFHSDASCSGGNTISSVTIPDTVSGGTFYYRSTLAGTFTITADDAGAITAGTQSITVNPGPADHLALSAGNGQTQVVNNYLSTQPRVKVEDQFGNGVLNYAVNFTVLTGGGSVDSPSVTSGAGGLAQVPYRLGTIAGTNTMKAENLALPGTPKTITFTQTGIADTPTQMELSGPATITAGECPTAYTATLRDQFGNTALATANTSLSLSGKADGTFYSDAGCTGGNEISSISITNGTSSRNFYYRNTKAEVVNLGINDGGSLTDDTYAVTVDPDVPYRIVLTGPDPITTGACSNQYTVTLWDQFNNVTTATTNTTVNLTGKSNGEFYSDSVCNTGNEISSVVVGTGNSNNTFYYKDPIAEQLNFTADDPGALIASSLSVYSNNGAPVDNGANLQFTNAYSNTGNDIAVTWTGFTDDDLSDHRLYTYTNADCSSGETDHGLTGSTGNSNATNIDGRTDGNYYGRVRAIDGFGNTRLSACSVDFITVDLTNPTDNGSDPQFGDAYDIDGNDVAVSWTAFTDVNPLDYQIYTYTASDCSAGEVDHGRTGTSAVSNNTLVDGLSDGQYYLRIRAHDAAGNSTLGSCSTDSIIIDQTNPTDPVVDNPPSGVTVPDLSVSWTHSTDANFQTHNVKACTSNDCSTGCVGQKTSVTSPTTITLVMNNTYYICVQGQDLAGRVSNWIASATTVEARNYPPNLVAIPDQPGAAENSAITTVNAEDVSGGDTDQDGEANTYTCTYDTTVNGSVSSGTACTSLTGVSFSSTTGVMNWTPNFFQSGNYEFKIVATSFQNLTDEEIFVINVANTDRPPLLRAIADQPSAAENTAITTVDATDDNTGNDTDIDLEAITYSCVYDTSIDGAVSATTLCTSITGLSFDTSTGIMNWTPGYFQAGTYEFKITGTAFSLSDDEIFSITVANTDRPPVIAAIADQSTNENVLISIDPSDTSGGDDDVDNEAITYSCVYDNVNDGVVAAGTACTSLAGSITFDTATGIINWTPNYFANQNGPDYEFKITATSGPDNLTDDEIFVITVNNVDRAPVLNAIASQPGAAEGTAITTIDATDSNSGNDNDIDNEAITYTCTYDTSIDGTVSASDLCTTVTGISFGTSTGVFDWTPGYFQAGTYEFKILATSGPDSLTDQKIFSITVANTDRPPLIRAIADQPSAAEGSAITTVDATDDNTSSDNDIDNEAITYTCEFDNTSDGSISGGAACSTLPGTKSFNSSTGILTWTPDYFTAQTSNTWEFRINATSGPDNLTDDEFFVITVANTDRAPDISPIGDQTVAEGSNITQINTADTSGGDTDIDNEAITYSCQYDTIVSGSILSGSNCSSLPGTVSFNTTTGVFDWQPGFFAFNNGPQYEIEITATSGPDSLTDTEYFVITTTNTDRPPVLAAIGNQVVNEGTAITQVNANDNNTGNDTDIDLELITYSCVYDSTIDGSVTSSDLCTNVSGLSFDTSTGVLDWTPNFFQSGSYEFKIVGTASGLSDDEIFFVNVNNNDRPPVLNTITDKTVAENAAMPTVNASDANTGGDIDIDIEAITYACTYDTTSDGSVTAGTACTSLPGSRSFNTSTGVLNWTPNFTSAGTYEIKIVGTSGPDTLSDDEIFVVTVTNTDRPPVLNAIANQPSAAEGSAITPINANDSNSGGDSDIDGDTITYTCVYDNTSNGAVTGGTNCSSLPGTRSFNTTTGALTWTPDYFTAQTSNTWEIKITGTSGPDTLTDDEIFVITVANTDRPPVLNAIGDQTIAEASAMTQVNASDFNTGNDTDIDLEAITYSCVYDTVIDGGVSGTTNCTSLSGVSFNTGTGVMDWTPGYFQSGNYEFKIVGTVNSLSDDEIFSITVNNTDRPPLLNNISNVAVAENAIMPTVNASDANTSSDNDIDNESIIYTCTYDTTIDSDVTGGTSCTSLPGTATFSAVTGVLNWTPNYSAAGDYEVKIEGTSGPDTLKDDEIFLISVSNTDRPPALANIANETVNENVAITQVNANDSNTSGDTDIDGDTLTYSCQYDTTVSASIVSGTNCNSLPGSASFNTTTGVLDWTPDFSANQSGPQYEIEITATGGPTSLSDTEIFVITVNNVDRAPVIAAIGDFGVNENTAITPVNANDNNTGNDTDIDGDALTYSCQFDTTVGGGIVSGANCSTLPGSANFNTSTGTLTWTPSYTAAATPTYEIEITATGGPDTLSDTEIFVITVANVDRAPVIAAITDISVNENTAMTQVNANDTSGGDTDIDGDTLTYSCSYDTTVSGGIVSGTTCTSLPGSATFNTSTGVLDWTPSYTAAQTGPEYEVEITATGGPDTLSDTEIFVVTVNNVDRAPLITAIGNQTVAENAAITQINAQDANTNGDTDIDGDTITWTCIYDTVIDAAVAGTNACTDITGITFNTTTGVMDWTPNYTQAGSYEFKITATAQSLNDTEIFSITVNNTDRAPVIATINDFSATENIAMTTVNANDDNTGDDTDIDGDTLTYTCVYDTTVSTTVPTGTNCTSLPGTATFNTTTGVLNWTPSYSATQDGPQYEVLITATGGPDTLSDEEVFVITVNNNDRPPVVAAIANQTINENSAMTQVDADDTSGGNTDIDGDTLTYACVYDTTIDTTVAVTTDCTTITGLSFNTTTGVMNWTPNYTQAGDYEFKITATGGPDTLSDDEIFSIIVNNVDRAPVIDTIADETVNENSPITQINANDGGDDADVDGDTLSYTCQFDTTVSTSIVSGNNCSTLPGTVSFNGTTGVLDWTPNYTAAATPTYEIEITATGGPDSLSDTEIFVITVNNVDRAPVLAAIGDQTVAENSPITVVNANDDNTGNDTDIDGDTLTYSCQYDTTVGGGIVGGTACSSLPGSVTFNTTTGSLAWTPDYSAAAASTYEIEIKGEGGPDTLSDTEIFVVTVTNTDRPPVLSAIGDQTVNENSAITQVNAFDTSGGDTDIDGDTLTYACVYDTSIDSSVAGTTACTTLTGVSFDTATGIMDWTPSYTQAGTYEFKITATGGPDTLSDDELFSITVNNVDRAPVIATINDETVNENVAITQVNADDTSGGDTDIDGDSLTYTCQFDTTVSTTIVSGSNCTALPGAVSFNGSTGVLDWTPDYTAASNSTYEIEITATGGPDTLSDTEIFVITVNNVDRAPVIAAIGDQTVNENSAISPVNANDTSGGDTDIDGDILTYSCQYDNTAGGGIVGGTACGSLPGTANFNTTTGELTWTPNYSAAATPTYEIEITATGGPDTLNDTEIFVITVNNVDRAPVIAGIGNQTVNENSAITQINANDTSGGDTDIDGDALTYSCQYDNVNNGAIVSGLDCSNLPGTVSFNTSTGIFDWTPNYTAAATPTYEIEITATGGPGSLSDTEFFVITVNNVDRAPVLNTIADQPSAAENSAITTVNASDTSGGDTDIDGDSITYSCTYDNTSDATVTGGTACTSLPGTVSFTAATGVLDWTPDYSAAATPVYEIKIVGTSGPDTLSDDEIFVVTVANTDRAPILATIADQPGVTETTPIAQINANDTSGGDTDIDGDAISYTCTYDTLVDNDVTAGTACTALSATFSTVTGILDWTPNISQSGVYEFKIVGSANGLEDDEIFIITVGNTDQPPVLAAIGDQTIDENAAMTAVNADDTSGGDTDVDGDAITYSCTYDTDINGAVGSGTDCSTITGLSFSTVTGTMTWTPSYTQAGTYEFKIIGTATPLSDDEIFSITVNNVDRAPVLATINDESVAENSAMTQVNANDTSGDDTDIDGDTITYACVYDTTADGAVAGSTACTTITGITFNTTTGVMDWTPNYDQAGTYEFKITGTAGALSDDEIFAITVTNTDRAPVLAAIGNETVNENAAITQVNANDTSGGDTDIDGDTITYSCLYDTTVSSGIVSGTACSSLPGAVTFNSTTGVLDWTPDYTAAANSNYEIEITGTAGALSDGEIFVISVNNVDRAPVLAAIGDETVSENAAITQVNAQDVNGGDNDIDGDAITFSCSFDNTVSSSIVGGSDCTSLPGAVSFNTSTGVLDWIPNYNAAATPSYEIEITASANALSDTEFFVITVNNTDRAPVLAIINDQTVSENSAITAINAADTSGGDTDVDGDAITYACVYDTTIDTNVAGSTACTTLTGVSFNTSTGEMTWTPNYDQAGGYEFKITGTAGALSDDEIFSITVNNTDRAPVLATIINQTVSENSAITQINANDTSGDDTDVDGDTITYACVYDTTIDSGVSATTNCTTITGLTFNTTTGVMDWTPDYDQSGNYEFKITGTAGALSDDEIFSITVNNTDRAPVLAAIGDQTVDENVGITTVNANDTSGGDTDIDGDTITYACIYDTNIDGAVSGTTSCTTLSGVAFNTTTGVFDWTPNYAQAGNYEFKITGTAGSLSDDEIYSVTVNNADRAPVLASIGNQVVNENAAITTIDANENSTGNDTDLDGDAITYTCTYDTTIDANVTGGTNCTSLTGLSFTAATGVMSWTPNYDASGVYEFKIVGSEGDLSDDEIFNITVNNTNRAPVLATISNQTVAENSAITQINADDTSGGDTDVDAQTITYACVYDTTVDSAVAGTTACTTLAGISFNTTTGVMDWTPDYDQAGNYEFKITGSDGSLSDDEIFAITVNNTDRAPVLATINDETVAENSAITQVNANDNTTGNDTDVDGDTITYACVYDSTIDTAVAGSTACTTITGLTFNSTTGVMDWTPNFTQAGDYEFKITGTAGALSDDEIFAITVTQTDLPPILAAIGNQTVSENSAITTVNANDDNTGNDTDRDGDAITYTCTFDTTVDAAVATGADCTTLTGVSFTAATGIMTWTPNYDQANTYEFKIVGSEGNLSDDEIFTITVNNVDRAPVIAAIGDQTVAENSAITQVDAADTSGGDTDADGDTITYTCFYDQSIDGSVASSNTCISLAGVSFTSGTGVLDWTPNFNQAGDYEFKIVANEGDLTDDELFSVTVTNTDQAPTLATINDQTVNENTAITAIDANDNSGGDTDPDGDAITYTCTFDNTSDGAVAAGSACSTLTGVSFNGTSGALTWTPNYDQANTYEFKIVGSEGDLSDDEIFVITVNNVDRAPVLATIGNQTVSENAAITQVDANDTSGGETDVDGDTITYACVYDTTIDTAVAGSTACTTITGLSFNTTTGVMDWTPDYDQAGNYEFKITGTAGVLSDDEIFSITVNNTDRAPVLATINDETVAENSAITQINANDTSGDDTDIDGDTITYACLYDTTIDATVAGSTSCTSLSGLSFNTTTGVMDWTPDFTQANTYEFKITGTAGALSDNQIFAITVTNTDQAPVLATINDTSVNENSALTTINAADTSGGDTDADGDTITYTCFYDTTSDGAVASTTACTTISGLSFTGATGVLDWTPDYTQAGTYEIKIVGSEGDLSDDEIFVITVNNVDRAPLLATINDETVAENSAITQVNAGDTIGGDSDADGDTITYSCVYDTTVDDAVAGSTACTALTGVSFNTTTGVMDWTPDYDQAGAYEFKIVGSEGDLSDDEIFAITVTNTDRAPVLAAIGNQTVAELVAITQIDANDNSTGNDTDADGDTISYSCLYDTTVDGSISGGTNCTSLPGTVSFNTTTGVFDYTPNTSAANTYEIEITGTAGALSGTAIFEITVTNANQPPVLAAIGDQTVNEGVAITQVNANDNNTGNDTDSDGDAITYSCLYDTTVSGGIVSGTACTSLPGTVSFNTSTGVFDWTPDFTAATASTYEIEITGTANAQSDGEIFVITVNNVDQAPVLAAIGDETVSENSAITQVNANDANTGNDTDFDGDAITYSCLYDQTVSGSIVTGTACTSLPGTVTFDTGTGVFDWTPDYTAAGTYEIEITGSEGDLSDGEIFVITVNNLDRAPILAAIADQAAAAENTAITQVNANDNVTGNDTDQDGDTITYTCYYDQTSDGSVATTNACTTLTGVSFTAATGVMDWTPNYSQAGTYEFRIIGSEGDLSDDEIFVVTVANTDRAPVLAAIGDETVSENSAITQVNANDTSGGDTDVDGDAITYSCLYDTTVSGGIVSGTACSSLPGAVTFTSATGVLDWTPDYSAAGSYEIEITGTAGALSDGEIFVITVNNSDRAPVLAAIGNQTVNENSAITQINADDTSGGDTDIDGDTISYSCLYDTTISGGIVSGTVCTSLPGTVTFNTTTGVLDWTPDFTAAGSYEIEITGTAGALSDGEIIEITVNNTDRAPTLAAIGNQTTSESVAITQVNANDVTTGNDTDPDGDTITYSCLYDTTISGAIVSGTACTSLPGTVSFNTTTGVFDWTPNNSSAGDYEIEITGSEGDLSDAEIFTVVVSNTNQAPVLAAIGDETVSENSPITQVNANDTSGGDTDVDGQTLTYSCLFDTTVSASIVSGTACSSLPGTVNFNTTTGVLDWTPDYTAAATPTYEIEITGSDGSLSDGEIFVITVNNTDRAPTLAAIGNETVAENSAITQVDANDLTGGETDPDGDTITYSCLFDNTNNGSISGGTACSSLPGAVTFNTTTGVLDWTPDYTAAATPDYEIEITGSEGDLSDAEIFVITVTNTDRAPTLAAIGNQAGAAENTPITTVNADDTSGGDTDPDGDTITYSCLYDTTISGGIVSGTACSSLPGTASFNTTTGVLDWTPSYISAGNYEVEITGSEGDLSDAVIFTITVANTDRAPVIAAIGDSAATENIAITAIDANDTSGGDTDVDGDTITYTCVYDNSVDAAVGAGTACTSLPGTATFDTATGVLNWTPSYTAAATPQYEIKVTGTANALPDDEIFVITVANSDRAPVLATISPETVNEGVAITQVDANDNNSGNDTDIDGDTITYTCVYDNTSDTAVSPGTACTSLPGTVSFNSGTGILDWTPDSTTNDTSPTWEIKITGTAGSLSDDEIFVITVNNVNQPPVLAAIGDQAVAENAAITQVNADDTSGGDTDVDGDTITYSCLYDNTNNGAIAGGTACTSLPGTVSFNTTTGVFDWTPDFTAAATPIYEIEITGTAGGQSDGEIFVVTVSNTDQLPVLAAIADQAGAVENSAITTVDANENSTGNDTDLDGETITYTCYYDNTNDGAVTNTNLCTSLAGSAFNTATGVFDWTPDYSTNDTSPTWEFKITGTANGASDDEFFVVTVANLDRAPVLAVIADQSLAPGAAITQINANDANSATDVDIDGDTITYSCVYDQVNDGAVAAGTACTGLTGVIFNTATGVLDWTTQATDAGDYEFKITGTAGALSDDEIFVISVLSPILTWTDQSATVVTSAAPFNFTPGGATAGTVDQTFTLTNTGNQDTGAITIAFTGNPKNFTVITDNCSATGATAGGGTCTILMRFDGASKPNKIHTATLNVTPANGPTANLFVQGEN